jgi:uncharacterized membrane protein YebE (DUF533 family)
MLDPKKLLDDLLGSKIGTDPRVRGYAEKAVQMAKDNPMKAGALAAVLLGSGKGRKLAGTALKLGGMAAVAGLAYKAYRDYQSGQQPGATRQAEPELLPPPADNDFHPARAPQGEAEFGLVIARAMVAAARADGHIDDAERRKIGDRIGLSGIDREEGDFLMAELAKPVDVDSLVAAARTEAQKVELYTASRIAIDPETRAERGYLDMLAGRLKLPDVLVDHIEATVAEAKSTETITS